MLPRTRCPAAFTLVELLVVISIIVILASLTLPVLGRAQASARAAQCVSNVSQLVKAFHSYAHEHHSLLPNTYRYLTPSGALSTGPTWVQSAPRVQEGAPQAGQLWSYYRSEKLVLCPVDTTGNGVFSYSSPVFCAHRRITEPINPSQALLLLDEHERYHIGPPRNPGDASSIEAGFGSIDRPAVRHGKRTPVGYFDGQARLVEFPLGFIAYDVEIAPWGKNDYYVQR
jgi:prepilin-type N-terminal cleavage/methylation domain-containing protein